MTHINKMVNSQLKTTTKTLHLCLKIQQRNNKNTDKEILIKKYCRGTNRKRKLHKRM